MRGQPGGLGGPAAWIGVSTELDAHVYVVGEVIENA
jgi:hypothetical protein